MLQYKSRICFSAVQVDIQYVCDWSNTVIVATTEISCAHSITLLSCRMENQTFCESLNLSVSFSCPQLLSITPTVFTQIKLDPPALRFKLNVATALPSSHTQHSTKFIEQMKQLSHSSGLLCDSINRSQYAFCCGSVGLDDVIAKESIDFRQSNLLNYLQSPFGFLLPRRFLLCCCNTSIFYLIR